MYVRLYQGEVEDEGRSLFSVWEIESQVNSGRGQPLELMTRTEDSEKPNLFVLRHFLTGKVLSLKRVKIAGENKSISCMKDGVGSIQFIPTAGDGDNLMDNNSCFLLAIEGQQMLVD